MEERLSAEDRLRRLEDIEEIRQLKARYCHCADRGFDGAGNDDEALAALFTEDGVWEGTPGPSRGHAAIAAAASQFMSFGFHVAVNPDIVVEGDTAHGRWWGLIPTTNSQGEAIWTAGNYENEFVRTPAGWRFEHLRFRPAFKTRHEQGWAREPFYRPGIPGRADAEVTT